MEAKVGAGVKDVKMRSGHYILAATLCAGAQPSTFCVIGIYLTIDAQRFPDAWMIGCGEAGRRAVDAERPFGVPTQSVGTRGAANQTRSINCNEGL